MPVDADGLSSMKATWEPGIGDHLRTMWHYKWFLIGGAAVIAEIVFLLLYTLPTPRFDAEASLRLTLRSDEGLVLDEDRVDYASQIYAELSESPRILSAAVENSGVALTTAAAASSFDVDWAQPPGFIDIIASADNAADAVALADGMAEALIAAIAADIDPATGPSSGGGANPDSSTSTNSADFSGSILSAEVVEPAIEPSSPASPRPLRDAFAAFIVSLVVLAEASALWRPARGLLPLSRTAERVSDLVGVPTMTLTGEPEDRTRLALFASRHLATKSAVLMVNCGEESLPAAPVRLAEAVTAGGRRALVVDGEGPKPNMHRRLGLPQSPGLAEVVDGGHALSDAVFESLAKSDVALLTSGGSDGSRQPLAAENALAQLGSGYEFIIVTVSSTGLLDGVAGAVAEQRESTVLVLDPARMKRRKLSELVHGFGGHEDVIAIFLISKSAAAEETKRLAARWWKRARHLRSESTTGQPALHAIKSGGAS
ncbi:MAG: hypothetical protein ACRBK7_12350 [Acidimicrobiales bacterium]